MSKRIRSKEREHDVSPTQQHQQQFIYIEIPVNKEDTLIVLSMKYNVSVPELKRLNSLLNDRDIFALNLIKIPIKPNSIFFHQFNDQLKYGEPNMTRLTNRLDSSLERELADSKILNERDDDDNDDDDDDEKDAKTTHFVGYASNGEQILETEFTNDAYYDNDTTALLLNHNNNNIEESTVMPNKQTKEAKKFLKKLDTNLESLITQNQELIQSKSGSSDQMMPSSFIIDTTNGLRNFNNISVSNNYFNTPDILFIAVFFMILLPIVIIVYRYYFYENGLNVHSHSNHH